MLVSEKVRGPQKKEGKEKREKAGKKRREGRKKPPFSSFVSFSFFFFSFLWVPIIFQMFVWKGCSSFLRG